MNSPEILTDLRGWFSPLTKSVGLQRVWLQGSRASEYDQRVERSGGDLDFVMIVDIFEPDKQRHIVDQLAKSVLHGRSVVVETRAGPIIPNAPPKSVALHLTLHDRASWHDVSPAVQLLNAFGATPVIGRHPASGRRRSIKGICAALRRDLHLFHNAFTADSVYWREWSHIPPYQRIIGWSAVENDRARDKLHRQIMAQLRAWAIILADYQDCRSLSGATKVIIALATSRQVTKTGHLTPWLRDGIERALIALSNGGGPRDGHETGD